AGNGRPHRGQAGGRHRRRNHGRRGRDAGNGHETGGETLRMKRAISDYSMLGALLLLCGFFSWRTWDEQKPTGAAAGRQVAATITKMLPQGGRVLIAARDNEEDRQFAATLIGRLKNAGIEVVETVHGQPVDARKAMNRIVESGGAIDVIACDDATAEWPVFQNLGAKIPQLAKTSLAQPRAYHWPNFLKTDNLLNVANQIVVI